MRIAILGAGGMGSVFGGLLAGDGHEVWFVDRWREHVEAIERDGLVLSHIGEQRRVAGRGTTDAADAGRVDLVMVWCKAQDSDAALRAGAPLFGERTIAFTAQNGLGNEERLTAIAGVDRVVYGATGVGATMIGPGHVECTEGTWSGSAVTWLGTKAPRSGALDEVTRALRSAGLTVEHPEDVDLVVWNKVATYAAGPLMGVLRLRLGTVAGDEHGRELLRAMTREVAAVANAKGIPLDADEALQYSLDLYARASSSKHLPSMLRDVLERRPTEIAATCERVAREGAAVGIATPVNWTMAQLVRTVERHYDDQILGDALAAIGERAA